MGDSRFEWTKPAAVIISLAALGATGSSAFAAYQSWQTAEANLAVADAALEVSEENLGVARQNAMENRALIHVRGVAIAEPCGGPDSVMTLEVDIGNAGRYATSVEWVNVSIAPKEPDGTLGVGVYGVWEGEREVVAPQAERIEVPMSCAELGDIGLERDTRSVVTSIYHGSFELTVQASSEISGIPVVRGVRDVTVR